MRVESQLELQISDGLGTGDDCSSQLTLKGIWTAHDDHNIKLRFEDWSGDSAVVCMTYEQARDLAEAIYYRLKSSNGIISTPHSSPDKNQSSLTSP